MTDNLQMSKTTQKVIETMINEDKKISPTQKRELLAKMEIEDTYISAEKVGDYLGMAKSTLHRNLESLPILNFTVKSGHRIFSLKDTLSYRKSFINSEKGKPCVN